MRGRSSLHFLRRLTVAFALVLAAAGRGDALAQSGDGTCDAACRAEILVCRQAIAFHVPLRDRLREQVASEKRQVEAWYEGMQRAEAERGWLGSFMDYIFGPDGKPHPGPVGAQVNQHIGELDITESLIASCEAEIAARRARLGGAPESVDGDNEDEAFRSAFVAYAATVAADYQRLGDEHWEISLTLKRMFDADTNDLRLAAEANKEVGYSGGCRSIADWLRRLELPPPAEKPTASTGGRCEAVFRENPYLCVMPPMCSDCDLTEYERDFKECCVTGDPAN